MASDARNTKDTSPPNKGSAYHGALSRVSTSARIVGELTDKNTSMKDKVHKAGAYGAGKVAAAALVASGVGAGASKLVGDGVTKFFGSKKLKRNLALLLSALLLPVIMQLSLIFATPALIASLIAQPEEAQAGTISCAGGTLRGDTVAEQAWNFFLDAGYTPQQVAGILGNIQVESQMNPFLAENNTGTPRIGYGWGLVQWTGSRHTAIRDRVLAEPTLGSRYYVAAPGYTVFPQGFTQEEIDALTLFELKYVREELQTGYKAVDTELRAAKDVTEATLIFLNKYEIPQIPNTEKRLEAAENYYKKFALGETSDEESKDSTAPSGGGYGAADQDPNKTGKSDTTLGYGALDSAPQGTTVSPSACSFGSGGPATVECPDKPGVMCINYAFFKQNTASVPCAPGTTELRITDDAWYVGTKLTIKLCALDGIKDVRGGPVMVNASVSKNFVDFNNDLKSQGITLSYTSSYRTSAEQAAISRGGSNSNAAATGQSNHQSGFAFDIGGLGGSYNRNTCAGKTEQGSCISPGNTELWHKINDTGLRHGLYFHDQEYWHIEFSPSGYSRGRPIPHVMSP